MYCKHCGKQIADDSTFCQYCGGKQTAQMCIDTTAKVEVRGNINAQIAPSFPHASKFFKKNYAIIISYVLWFLINLIMLISGNGHNHFWPYIHKTGGYYDKFFQGGKFIKESTNYFKWV